MDLLHLFFGIDPLIYESTSSNEKSKFQRTYFFLIIFFITNVLLSTYISNMYLDNMLLSLFVCTTFFVIILNLLKISIFNIPTLVGKSFIKKYINLETLIRFIIYLLASVISSFVIFTSIFNKEILDVNKSTDTKIYESISQESVKSNDSTTNHKLLLNSEEFDSNTTHFHLITVSNFCFYNTFFKVLFTLLFLSFFYIQWNMYDLKNNVSYLYYKKEKDTNQEIIDRDKLKTQEYVNQLLHKRYKRKDLAMNLFQSIETVPKIKISFEELI